MDFGDGGSFAVVPTVYKREDYKRTKHDAVFSKWKVLIGSSDWEDFKNGKDGVGRYRVQNLPRKSCPGLYELGVAVIGHDQARKLDLNDVLAAYLGQAESVRTRLQRYGRSGAHLRNVNDLKDCETIDSPDNKKAVTSGLFEDIFAKDGSIVFRWAPMGSKREAEATEGMLLSTFDYAWNKGSNGERRRFDLVRKLGDGGFMSKRKSGIFQELFPFLRNNVGIRIKGEKHVLKEERNLSFDVDQEKKKKSNDHNFFTSILKLSRSRPQLVSDRFEENGDDGSGSVCGVLLENGGCCNKSPVKGRKRCVEHKGQRICRVSPETDRPPQPEIFAGHDQKDSYVMCGVILPDMETCGKRPVSGRKRCEDHKGMRINAFLFLLNKTDREKTVKYEEKSDPESHTDDTKEEEGSLTRFCEATTKNGLSCTRSSPKGSKRCWQHKEKTSEDSSPGNVCPVAGKQVTCGVKVCNGSICERSPVKGRKRCEEHKGMRISPS